MKINCAIIVDSLEDKEMCMNKFSHITNKSFFIFDKTVKSLNLLKSKKNIFPELELFYEGESFFILHPDEEILFWDEEEIFKSHHNLIVDKWIVKVKRSNAKVPEVSKIFIKSSFNNVKRFDEDWCNLYSAKGNLLVKLQEYIFANDIELNELFIIYQYVLEKLKISHHNQELIELINSIIEKYPSFIELINLWGDYLYEMNLFMDAKIYYENALRMAPHRDIYDFMPMIPSMHKNHPNKMLANIEKLISKYDTMI